MDLTSRIQKYVNYPTHTEAAACGKFDLIQIKYDGWWARIVIASGVAKIYSRQGALKEERPVPGIEDMVLLGEFMKGTNRSLGADSHESGMVRLFDALTLPSRRQTGTPNENVMMRAYDVRHSIVTTLLDQGRLPGWCKMVESFDTEQTEELWQSHVITGEGEGLVFRNSNHNYPDAVIGRVKNEFTNEYVATRVVEGAGKRKGKVGAIIGSLYVNGELVEKLRVGGGFSDAEGEDIFNNFDKYRGRVMEVKGWQLFESGALRHPNLVKWRDDKRPEECVWPI